MGCDIHFCVEKQIEGTWIGVYSSDFTPSLASQNEKRGEGDWSVQWKRTPVFKSRWYRFFALLAGVRGDGPDPKGIPDGISTLSQAGVDSWNGDGHSHSWETLENFCRAYATASEEECDDKYLDWLTDTYKENLSEYRVIFWFDN